MTQLETNLGLIKNQKDTYIIPENLRAGVTALGVTGTLTPAKEEQSKNATPTTSQQTITPDTGKALSSVVIAGVTSAIDANIVQANIRAGVTILGVQGNLEPDKPDQTKTCTPTTSQQTIEPDTGYELASVTVNAVTSAIDANIVAGNIKSGVTILGVTGTLVEEDGVRIIHSASELPETGVEGNICFLMDSNNTTLSGMYKYTSNAWVLTTITNAVYGTAYDTALADTEDILGNADE